MADNIRKGLKIRPTDRVEEREGIPGSSIRTVTINPPQYDNGSYPLKRPEAEKKATAPKPKRPRKAPPKKANDEALEAALEKDLKDRYIK